MRMRTATATFSLLLGAGLGLAPAGAQESPAPAATNASAPAAETVIQFSGSGVTKLQLSEPGGSQRVYAVQDGQVSVPPGNYASAAIVVSGGHACTFRATRYPFAVPATSPFQLEAGGPLTNTLTLRQSGVSGYYLSHALQGRGDWTYVGSDGTPPPMYTVRHDGAIVQTNTFQYG